MSDMSPREIAELISRAERAEAKAEELAKHQKHLNSKNQELKDALGTKETEVKNLAEQLKGIEGSEVNPKEFEILKKRNGDLETELGDWKTKYDGLEISTIGSRYGVLDDPDARELFATKFRKAREAEGFEEKTWAESLKESTSWLFGQSATPPPKDPPAKTPGGGAAPPTGSAQRAQSLDAVNEKIAKLRSMPNSRDALHAALWEKDAIVKEIAAGGEPGSE
jgi:hypothetical protein